jgi:hypothetical protein
LIDETNQALPRLVRQLLGDLLDEVRDLEGRVKAIDRQLT